MLKRQLDQLGLICLVGKSVWGWSGGVGGKFVSLRHGPNYAPQLLQICHCDRCTVGGNNSGLGIAHPRFVLLQLRMKFIEILFAPRGIGKKAIETGLIYGMSESTIYTRLWFILFDCQTSEIHRKILAM